MQQSQDLNLPPTPTQYTNPLQTQDMGLQSSTASNLISGNLPSWLQSTINPNNSQSALTAAQGLLAPQFRDTLTQINNDAANNNQLQSSTFTDALARSQSDLNSQYQSIVSQQAINDANQANQNKLNLFGSGLGTLQNAVGNEQADSNATNEFNLQNYSNQVASAVQQNQNANKANPLTQLESFISPFANDYYKSQGINNVPGYGVGQTLGLASSAIGLANELNGGQGQGTSQAGMTASNNPFYVWNPYSNQYGNNLYKG